MIRTTFLASALSVTSMFAIASSAQAQYPSQSYQPQMVPSATPDADALAAAMRRLADNPRDLDALIAAGELSLKVGDASGAAALFKRAEGVDPMNGRIKAGMARILVTQERPGEALRYFDQAIGYGLDPRSFVGDRGLAFDLIGEQERAQRDYRLALKTTDSDEVRRRYALSLGISGKQDGALAEIDTLLRRGDRGAWRARAFILAMTGDVPGATSIATRMMPPGMAQGLQPFFVRLPTLMPIDKAFAVHFGEVRATPERLADARLVPILPVLGPDPDARTRVAAVVAAPVAAPVRTRERRRRAATPQVLVASAAPRITTLPPAPGFGSAGESPTDPARSVARVVVAPASAPSVVVAPTRVASVPPVPAPSRFARLQVDPIQKPTLADYAQVERGNRARQQQAQRIAAVPVPRASTATPPPTDAALLATLLAVRAPAPIVALAATPPPVDGALLATQLAVRAPAPIAALAATQPPMGSSPSPAPAGGPALIAAATPLPAPTSPASVGPVPAQAPGLATTQTVAGPTLAPVATGAVGTAAVAPIAATASSSVPTPLRASEDSILTRIVAGLPVSGDQLGGAAAPPPPTAVASVPASLPAAVATVGAQPAPAAAVPRRAPVAAPAAKPPAVVATRPVVRPRTAPVVVDAAPPVRRGARARTVEIAEVEPSRSRVEDARSGSRRGRRAGSTRAGEPAAEDRRADARGTGRRAVDASDADAPVGVRGTRGRGADRRALAAASDDRAQRRSGRNEEIKAARTEPPRIWVQVAGGANQGDLPKAWSAVQSRAPALKGRPAYSTPLRATNRVVTGPFKTDAEARAFVNQLARQGVSAFPFTSDKGQKLAKLPPR